MIIDQLIDSDKNSRIENNNISNISEKPVRSIFKSVSWRIVGTLDTITISWFITGKVGTALTIGSIELITKMVLYFFHERIWNLIKWGKQ